MLISAVRASWLRRPHPRRSRARERLRQERFVHMCLVEVETDTGLVGLGEAKAAVGNLGNYAAIVALIREELAPPLIGRDPRDITAIWQLCYNGSRAHYATREGRTFPDHRPAGHQRSPRSAHRHRPLGSARPVTGCSRVAAARRPVSRARPRLCERGLGARGRHSGRSSPSTSSQATAPAKLRVGLQIGASDSAARVREVRETLGPDIGIMVDAHGTWSVREAQRFARKVESDDLAWLEEPVSPDNLAGQAEARRSTDIPIAAGESEQTRFAFREMIDARAVDICQPDPAIAGGITRQVTTAHLRAGRGERAHGGAAPVGLGHPLRGRAAPDDRHAVRHARGVLPGHNPLLSDLVK